MSFAGLDNRDPRGSSGWLALTGIVLGDHYPAQMKLPISGREADRPRPPPRHKCSRAEPAPDVSNFVGPGTSWRTEIAGEHLVHARPERQIR